MAHVGLLGAMVPSHLLVSDGINAQDEEWAWEHVLPLDGDLSECIVLHPHHGAICRVPQRPAPLVIDPAPGGGCSLTGLGTCMGGCFGPVDTGHGKCPLLSPEYLHPWNPAGFVLLVVWGLCPQLIWFGGSWGVFTCGVVALFSVAVEEQPPLLSSYDVPPRAVFAQLIQVELPSQGSVSDLLKVSCS